MFWCCNTFFLAEPGTPFWNLGFFVVGIVCIWLTFCVKQSAVALSGVLFKEFKDKRRDVIPGTSQVAEFFNPAAIFQLPDSNTHVQTYNSLQSLDSLMRQGRQFIGIMFLLCWLIVLTIDNLITHKFDISNSQEWQTLYYTVMIVTPFGHFLQYVILGYSYKFDEGFFTQSTTYFEYTRHESKELISTNKKNMEGANLKTDITESRNEKDLENGSESLVSKRNYVAQDRESNTRFAIPMMNKRKSKKKFISGVWKDTPPQTMANDGINCSCSDNTTFFASARKLVGLRRVIGCPHNPSSPEDMRDEGP